MSHYGGRTRVFVTGFVLATALQAAVGAGETNAILAADADFVALKFQDAAKSYEEVLRLPPATQQEIERCWHAYGRAIASHLRADKPVEAERVALKGPSLFKEPLWAARAERSIGNLYLQIRHWGSEVGGHVTRPPFARTSLHARDRRAAIEHLERARELYSECVEKNPAAGEAAGGSDRLLTERTDCLFELAAALNAFNGSDTNWAGHWYGIGEAADEEIFAADESDGDRLAASSGKEIPVDEKGRPIFLKAPRRYSADLPATRKFKAVLSEIEELDTTPTRAIAARAAFRRAMAAREHYQWDEETVPGSRPRIKDDETYAIVGGRERVVRLPSDEDPLELLRRIPKKYPDAGETVVEAKYSIGAVYQARGQYREAIQTYLSVVNDNLHTQFADYAYENIRTIKSGEATLATSDPALAGQPTRLTLSSRNEKHFVLKLQRMNYAKYLRDRLAAAPNEEKFEPSMLEFDALVKNEKAKEYLEADPQTWEQRVDGEGKERGALTPGRARMGDARYFARNSPSLLHAASAGSF